MDNSEDGFPQKTGIIISMVFTPSYHCTESPKQATSKISMIWKLTSAFSGVPSTECV